MVFAVSGPKRIGGSLQPPPDAKATDTLGRTSVPGQPVLDDRTRNESTPVGDTKIVLDSQGTETADAGLILDIAAAAAPINLGSMPAGGVGAVPGAEVAE